MFFKTFIRTNAFDFSNTLLLLYHNPSHGAYNMADWLEKGVLAVKSGMRLVEDLSCFFQSRLRGAIMTKCPSCVEESTFLSLNT